MAFSAWEAGRDMAYQLACSGWYSEAPKKRLVGPSLLGWRRRISCFLRVDAIEEGLHLGTPDLGLQEVDLGDLGEIGDAPRVPLAVRPRLYRTTEPIA